MGYERTLLYGKFPIWPKSPILGVAVNLLLRHYENDFAEGIT